MNYFHLGLALLMLITGSINTLSVKWADTMVSESSDGVTRGFDHPFLQACGMFLGETLCMAVFFLVKWYKRRKQVPGEELDPILRPRSFSPLIFWPPAMCDMTATSIQYIGLTLTYASSFQMLRGAVIIFTGIFSKLFLRAKIGWYKWVGIFFVICGLITVGLCDMLNMKGGGGGGKNETTNYFHAEYYGAMIREYHGHSTESNKSSSDILLGDALIVCAQVIVATQMVYEEKFISKYDVPALQAVGWEGTFGFLTLSTLLIPMYFVPVGPKFANNPRHVLEDAYDGLYQLSHNGLLLTAFCGTILSIAFFNFAGISVTKEMSATTRMVLDSVRTLVIWAVSLAVGWQAFFPLQLLGFIILVAGMCIYNDIIIGPCIRKLLLRFGCLSENYNNLTEEEDEDNTSEPERSVFDPTISG